MQIVEEIAIKLIELDNGKAELLLDELRDGLELELTGWDLFKMRRPIFLALASLSITYSVFIVEMFQS